MADNNQNENQEMFVTLSLDSGEEIECMVVTIFEANKQDYIALLPTEGEANDEGEVYLYRFSEDEDGNPDLTNIESDEEYEIVADAFDEWLDAQEYDELVSAEEDEEV